MHACMQLEDSARAVGLLPPPALGLVMAHAHAAAAAGPEAEPGTLAQQAQDLDELALMVRPCDHAVATHMHVCACGRWAGGLTPSLVV